MEKKTEIKISIARINMTRKTFPIRSQKGSTLLIDKRPPKVLAKILDDQKGKKQPKKELRDIPDEIEQAKHYLEDGSIGFPAAGFKTGLIEATSFVGGKFSFTKKQLKGIQITNAINDLIPIKYKKENILIHNIGINTKHTPQFHDWSCELEIQFDQNNISQSDIAELINYAGVYSGIGIWGPRCKSGGSHGMYEMVTTS